MLAGLENMESDWLDFPFGATPVSDHTSSTLSHDDFQVLRDTLECNCFLE